MNLIERLLDNDGENIPIHSFIAEYEEVGRSKINVEDMKTDFSMDATEGAELDTIITSSISGRELKDVLYLATENLVYMDAASVRTRLGI